jgi:inorganic triphosphatase YgiF
MMDYLERELKLVPASDEMLDELEQVDRLGPWEVVGRRRELQHNAFFDSPLRALRKARIGFRRRTIEGQPMAIWTIKGDAQHVGAVASRSEIELHMDAHTPPALVLTALCDAARSRGAKALAESVDDALASGGLPLAAPVLETRTDRRILDLEDASHGWRVELALDRMELVGHAYREVEIEAELKHGDEAALDAVREAIAALGEVQPSQGSKLSRGLAAAEG